MQFLSGDILAIRPRRPLSRMIRDWFTGPHLLLVLGHDPQLAIEVFRSSAEMPQWMSADHAPGLIVSELASRQEDCLDPTMTLELYRLNLWLRHDRTDLLRAFRRLNSLSQHESRSIRSLGEILSLSVPCCNLTLARHSHAELLRWLQDQGLYCRTELRDNLRIYRGPDDP